MGQFLTLYGSGELSLRQTEENLLALNGELAGHALTLSREQAAAIAEARRHALAANGRAEFRGGIPEKIVRAFADSPYVDAATFAETVAELLDLFYTYKNETLDRIGDDDLIAYMKKYYNGVCRGSLDLLAGIELERLARDVRAGRKGEATDLPSGRDVTDDDFSGGEDGEGAWNDDGQEV